MQPTCYNSLYIIYRKYQSANIIAMRYFDTSYDPYATVPLLPLLPLLPDIIEDSASRKESPWEFLSHHILFRGNNPYFMLHNSMLSVNQTRRSTYAVEYSKMATILISGKSVSGR